MTASSLTADRPRERAVLDVATLPIYVTGTRAPLWWGMLLLVTIETTVFATFATTYFYLRFLAADWPLGEATPPDLLLPSINTAVLVASGLIMHWGDRGMRSGDVRRLKIGLGAAIALGVLFLVLKVVEYSDVSYRWDTNAYGSIVWTIVIFHSAHVASVLLKGSVVLLLAFRGHFTQQRHLGVQINGMYWYFVCGIWIPMYIILYWVPRW